jgi:hypothetical protein
VALFFSWHWFGSFFPLPTILCFPYRWCPSFFPSVGGFFFFVWLVAFFFNVYPNTFDGRFIISVSHHSLVARLCFFPLNLLTISVCRHAHSQVENVVDAFGFITSFKIKQIT